MMRSLLLRLPLSAVILAVLLGGAFGCSDDPTAIVVEVSSDMGIPQEVDELRARILSTGGVRTHAQRLDAARMPARFTIVAGPDAPEAFDLAIDGLLRGGVLVTVENRLRFLREHVLVHRVRLYAACRGVACRSGLTCAAGGGCVDGDVAMLPRWTGGPLPGARVEAPPGAPRPRADAAEESPRDAAMDAPGAPESDSIPTDADAPDASQAPPPPSCASAGCAALARCAIEGARAVCSCPPGYRGDGTTCEDVDECAGDGGACHEQATCSNQPGGHTCTCKPGFAGDGGVCRDAVAPQIASTKPLDGDVAIWRASDVVITFSEPMDASATAAALSVRVGDADLDGTTSWDAAGRVLTWKPAPALPYDAEVTVTVGAEARDLAGNAIDAPRSFRYRVVRRATRQVFSEEPIGHVSSNGFVIPRSSIVGDKGTVTPSVETRSFLGFNLAQVPVGATVRAATLHVQLITCTNDPFGRLGSLRAEWVSFGTSVDASDFDLPVLAPPGALGSAIIGPSSDVSPGWKTADLTAIVQSAIDRRGELANLVQLRLRFDPRKVESGTDDLCSFGTLFTVGREPRIELDYEYP